MILAAIFALQAFPLSSYEIPRVAVDSIGTAQVIRVNERGEVICAAPAAPPTCGTLGARGSDACVVYRKRKR